MKLICKNYERGLKVKFKDRIFFLRYPKEIWENYPADIKNILVDNLVHLLTINLPLMSGIKKLKYNTSTPLFRSFFHTVVINSLPAAVHDYDIVTGKIIKQFLNINYEFKDYNIKIPSHSYETDERAIVLSSFGKDSLLSLGICNEIGLDPVTVYINDTVSSPENQIKLKFGRKISKKFNFKYHTVRNEIEKLNDFEFWGKDESCIGYTHMMSGFSLITLPFAYYYKTKYIVLGNQQNMNYGFRNKDGFLTYPSFDQTRLWMKQQDIMIKMLASENTHIMSVIEPLTNIAITKILHTRYKELGKYQISCDLLDKFHKTRWCSSCSKCARLSIFMKANNVDTKSVGLRSNLLDKKHKKLYCLFDGKERDVYEKSKEARDEQLLAFYMAYRNNHKGYLINLFKRTFLKEAKEREDALSKKFFSIHKSVTMPKNIKKNVLAIFKEELKNLQ